MSRYDYDASRQRFERAHDYWLACKAFADLAPNTDAHIYAEQLVSKAFWERAEALWHLKRLDAEVVA